MGRTATAGQRLRRRMLLAFAVAMLAGCDSSTPSPALSRSPATPEATPTRAPLAASVSPPPSISQGPQSGPSGGDASGIRLMEVLFDPLPGGTAFVELANVGSEAVDVSRLTLRAGGSEVSLGSAGSALASAAILVVAFDQEDRTEAGIIHAPQGVDLPAATGVAELRDATDRVVDRVAWGARPDAVSTGPGGVVPERVAEGSSIGRPPGALAPAERLDWVVYGALEASPGVPNPLPRAEVLLPLDGAILDEPDPILAWYPVVGAAMYRVQIAAGASFATSAIDTTVTDPEIGVGTLPAGTYTWRVASISVDGTAASFSEPSTVSLEGSASAAATVVLARAGHSTVVSAAATVPRRLSVPYLTQHKDTRMLLLESPVEHGTHAWDVDHGRPSPGDPADSKNCSIAAVAIMNHFFGGDMSQDRLGYEILRNRQTGPELDLMYGTGLTVLDATTMLDFALGGGVTVVPAYFNYDDYWRDITTQVDAGRPVMAANSRHTYVITGYAIENGHRILYVSDPANGRYRRDLDATSADPQDQTLWITPAHPVGRHQEPGVTKDSDGDGVVDFDETERFGTNPGDADTDADKLPDKPDIATGIFDPNYGYAIHPGSAGRDFDADGVPTERDKDSDEGACWDGEEDKSGNGHRDGSETYNFDTSDDVCMAYRVKITWSETYGGLTDKFIFEGVIDTVDPNALGEVVFLTGTGTVEGSRRAWAACSVNIDAPSGKVAAFFGATIVGDKVTIGAFASEGVLLGVNTQDFEMPKEGGRQFFSGGGGGSLCPYSWDAKVEAEALFDH